MRKSRFAHLKSEVLRLRKNGLSYSEIQENLGVKVAMGTLSNWCSRIVIPKSAERRLRRRMSFSPERKAEVTHRAIEKRIARRLEVVVKSNYLADYLRQDEIAKISLAMLYLGEGRKDERNSVGFGNSNAGIISLFMRLFMQIYKADISKFRITIQCRADQDVRRLERYWKKVINISGIRFYKTRVDPRTVGRPTKKEGYMGVCCITYIDNRIQFELVNLGIFLCQ